MRLRRFSQVGNALRQSGGDVVSVSPGGIMEVQRSVGGNGVYGQDDTRAGQGVEGQDGTGEAEEFAAEAVNMRRPYSLTH